MDVLERILETTPPERVIYTTYTNAGANEAIQRAMDRFGFDEEQFPYFRTLHSLCYRNMPRASMMGFQDYRTFGKLLGYVMSGAGAMSLKDGTVIRSAQSKGDSLLTLENLRRSRMCSYKEICESQLIFPENPRTLEHFSKSYAKFKTEIGKIDFADQIERFLISDEPLDIDYLFVDEAQDLSKMQWKVIDILARSAKEVFIAGDDKQSIYEFSGGDPESLIQREGERIVLDTCYRLPETILSFAERIAERISSKTPYQVKAKEGNGSVKHIRGLHEVDLSEGSWLLLARNRALLDYYEREVIGQGYLFKSDSNDRIPKDLLPAIATWRKLIQGEWVTGEQVKPLYDKYLPTGSCVKRGFKKVIAACSDQDMFSYEDLKNEYGLRTNATWDSIFPIGKNLKAQILAAEKRRGLDDIDRIEITTIHSTKGREADNVVVLPDMTWTTWQGFQLNPDAEHRTFYVAATRAKQNLFIHEPLTANFYALT